MNSKQLSSFLEYPVEVAKPTGKLQIDLTVQAGLTKLLQEQGGR